MNDAIHHGSVEDFIDWSTLSSGDFLANGQIFLTLSTLIWSLSMQALLYHYLIGLNYKGSLANYKGADAKADALPLCLIMVANFFSSISASLRFVLL